MMRKLLFLITAVLLITACGKTKFDADNAQELATLHTTPDEYTESEIRDIEDVFESFIVKQENMVNGIIDERDDIERQKKIVKMAAECKSNESIFDTIGTLAVILKINKYADKDRFNELMKRLLEVQYTVDIIRREM